ncbi:MAG: murein L,D-transpeptidase catalytic domain family protein [Bacteroidetes bacterium]|nr:murein L,D-transpeptidase catalytic domain family protein [Bacteroidota bacterium]
MRNLILGLLVLVLFASAAWKLKAVDRSWKVIERHFRPEFFGEEPQLPVVSGLENIPADLRQSIPVNGKVILVDFRLPSSKKRLWLVKNQKISLHCRVAHGKNSGEVWAKKFSNEQQSFKSCLGTFTTGKAYVGEKGLAMKLHGTEKGINDNAYERGIVFHGGSYVSTAFILKNGRIGRSHGCFVTEPRDNAKIIRSCASGTKVIVVGHRFR